MDDPAFTSDGCTGFFDVWRGVDLLACCTAHDLSWFQHPGDWGVWWVSNLELAICFAKAGVWEVSALGLAATCTIGAILFMLKPKRN